MTKYLLKIISIVSEFTEISPEHIVSKSHKEDVTFARKLFVEFCYRYGLPTSTIAEYLNRSKDGVRKLYLSLIRCEKRTLELDVERKIAEKLSTEIKE